MGKAQKIKAARQAERNKQLERHTRRRRILKRLALGASVLLAVALTFGIISSSKAPSKGGTVNDTEQVQTMTIESEKGTIQLELYPGKAPKTVAHLKELAGKGFYNGLTFHRVVPDFVIQGGDPKGDGTGGSGQTIPFEQNDLKHDKGVIAMARSQSKDSADSQFYITLAAQPSLDGQYVVFGKVTSGMEVVEKIQVGDKMTKVTIP
jgi:cyclophilin family peptidyl-prolyl cis-trans isomerase